MKRLLIILVVVIVLLTVVPPVYAITNGQPDGESHPYVGLVLVQDNDGGLWRGSGVLISPTIVLTAGHMTDGAVSAWVYFDENVEANPAYPSGGQSGTAYTYPGYYEQEYAGEVGIIVLSDPIDMDEYGVLPEAGLVDTLPKMADVDIVGYGLQEMVTGGGQPELTGDLTRQQASAKIIGSMNVRGTGTRDDIIAITANPGQGKGGAAFGDSGGPVLLEGTNTVVALHAYQINRLAKGMTLAQRIDDPGILSWINGF